MTENTENLKPSPADYVREFHKIFGHPVLDTPTFATPREDRLLRSKLILEEASETYEADKDNDLVEIADGLADTIWVTYGAALAHGVNLDASFGNTEFTPSEILKIVFKRQGRKVRPKPTLHVIGRKGLTRGINAGAVAYSKYILETPDSKGDPDRIRSLLTTIVSSCYFASYSYGIDIDEILEIVYRSNMSKLGADGKPLLGKGEDVDGYPLNKVLKGPDFFEPKELIKENLLSHGAHLG